MYRIQQSKHLNHDLTSQLKNSEIEGFLRVENGKLRDYPSQN